MSLLIDILLEPSDEMVQAYFGPRCDWIDLVQMYTKEQLLAMLDDQEFVKKHNVEPRDSPENRALWEEFNKKYPHKNN